MYTVIFKLSPTFRAKHFDKIQKSASLLPGFGTIAEATRTSEDSPSDTCVFLASFDSDFSRDTFRLILRHQFDIPSLY